MARFLATRLRRPADVAAIAFVVLVGGALVAHKVAIAVHVGPGWDTYAFLANAAEFAGRGFGYTELHRPPLLSWLTALVFRSGAPLSEAAIQWVDGALSLSGLLAFYLLARRRLSPAYAAAGALALLAVTPLWSYLGVGYTDTASIALSTWLVVVLTLASERSPRWYLLAGPLYVAAVLTRFTALLMAFPALVWVLLRWSPFRQARQLSGAAALGVATYLPAALFYHRRFGDVLFPFIIAFGFSEEVSAPGGEGAAAAQAAFYARNVASLLGPGRLAVLTAFLLLIGTVGLVRGVGRHFESRRPSARRIATAILGTAPALLAQLGGGMVLRQVTIPVAVLVLWYALGPREPDARTDGVTRTPPTAALDAVMLAWLLAYLDFHGHQTIQVPRYFITMAPSVLYFVMRGWSMLAEELTTVFRTIRSQTRHTRTGIPELGPPTVVAVIVAALLAGTVAWTPREPDRYVVAARESARWLLRADPGARDAVVYSDVWPLTAWYLGTNVRPMPSFEETAAFGHELDRSGARFFFTLRARRFPDFREIHDAGSVVLLERASPPETDLPRVTYLGKSWDNYLEEVTGFRFYLESSAGRYGWEGSAFMDAFPAEELASSDAVAVYGVRWRSRHDAEQALRGYLESGGSVVLDASRNLDGLAYRFGDTILFDTVVRRGQAPGGGELPIRVAEGFVAAHPELADIGRTAAFVDEGGGPWTGAVYEARPDTPPLETLVWIGERPAVQVREVGKGRLYLIAYNLVWHAFYSGDPDEAAIVSAVFDDAISRGEVGAP